MKKFILGVIKTSFIFILCMYSCNDRKSSRSLDANYQKKSFDSLMAESGKRDWRTIEISKQMYNDTSFMEIYNHGSSYYDDMISFLANDTFLDTVKYSPICIRTCTWSMQNLSLKEYLGFCNRMFELFNDKKIANYELFEAISPGFGGRNIIGENYKEADVVILLHNIQNTKNISEEFKKEIKEILAGKYR